MTTVPDELLAKKINAWIFLSFPSMQLDNLLCRALAFASNWCSRSACKAAPNIQGTASRQGQGVWNVSLCLVTMTTSPDPELSLDTSCAILTLQAWPRLHSPRECWWRIVRLPYMASFQLKGIYINSSGRKNACCLSSKQEMRNPALEIFDYQFSTVFVECLKAGSFHPTLFWHSIV